MTQNNRSNPRDQAEQERRERIMQNEGVLPGDAARAAGEGEDDEAALDTGTTDSTTSTYVPKDPIMGDDTKAGG